MAYIDIDNDASKQISICEALDRVLNKGAVITGELTISVADIDLIYLSLQAVLTSVETARHMFDSQINDAVKEVK
ncbi:Gas vesicle protein [Desulfocicer vacuolatum DSM 3385]|uniref:Gas vesicle protein n=1 Tax=Desulfocicer vacuolatum DSM 3385 TaxID=1121400 RepID=A0A1W2BDZ8_9BACT|nr:gas vesicle protein [Desulfocicer vacuolatum]SMC70942.1 Gas vesicle protein [Desulfocicer vacuolatum DSM 3385]